jgi:hypothetical protein
MQSVDGVTPPVRVELLEPQRGGLQHRRLCEAFVSLPDKSTDSGVVNCPLLDSYGTQVGHIRMVSEHQTRIKVVISFEAGPHN